MAKVNIVLEGRYKNTSISIHKDCLQISGTKLVKDPIISYELIDETNKNKYSFWKGALGVALLGGIGAVAGIGGKKKEYLIAIEWKHNGLYEYDKSLILLDERYYKTFIRSMF